MSKNPIRSVVFQDPARVEAERVSTERVGEATVVVVSLTVHSPEAWNAAAFEDPGIVDRLVQRVCEGAFSALSGFSSKRTIEEASE